MPQHLIASAATLKAIRPGCMERRLSDGAGLYLLLFVNGGSHGWRLDYRAPPWLLPGLVALRNRVSSKTTPAPEIGPGGRDSSKLRFVAPHNVDSSPLSGNLVIGRGDSDGARRWSLHSYESRWA